MEEDETQEKLPKYEYPTSRNNSLKLEHSSEEKFSKYKATARRSSIASFIVRNLLKLILKIFFKASFYYRAIDEQQLKSNHTVLLPMTFYTLFKNFYISKAKSQDLTYCEIIN